MIAPILSNERLHGDYFRIRFFAPEIAAAALPGQFVHVRVDRRNDNILRRPFSIHNAGDNAVTVVYKVVGTGTRRLSELAPGEKCDLLGPLGRAFSLPSSDLIPVAVCGGYGSAATYMLTRQSARPGFLLLGARSKEDLILGEEYEKKGFEVRIATDDGSAGIKGRVTDLIPALLTAHPAEKFFFCGCGPHPMLMALAKMMKERHLDGQLSIDHLMCCGVGACFGCVVKVADPKSEKGWKYARACTDGPVFDLDEVFVE